MNHKLAIIIPTFNRADCIKRLLESIARQDVLPEEIIIVDGGTPGIEDVLRPFNNIGIKHIISSPPSLTRQKNIGISKLSAQINLIGFIDDDIVFGKDSLKNMLAFWETAGPEIGGASFNNISNVFRRAGVFEQLFFINSFQGGKILKSGFNSQISSTDRTKRVDWLFGGITIWRRVVVEEFKFDERFTGSAY
ncbi:MAG: glycosyltransferase family A protein, partial [Candidatus Omnitrophica bacterium]|nr:glycosyltransferase family A protein [Candidatus Omnitrophota bacterium]